MSSSPSRLHRWRSLLVPGLLVAVLVGIGIVFPLAWLQFGGKSSWTRTQEALRARGEKLTIVELAPPPPPPEENFFADPLWTELSDVVLTTSPGGKTAYAPRVPDGKRQLDVIDQPAPADLLREAKSVLPKGETGKLAASTSASEIARTAVHVLAKTADPQQKRALAQLALRALAGDAALYDRIAAALRDRPMATFPTDYSEGFLLSFPHITYLFKLSKAFHARANARLALGEPSAADVDTLFKLADTTKTEPTLISLLIRMSAIGLITNTIESGIRQHAWSAGELSRFQRALGAIDLVEGLALALRGERGGFNQTVNDLRSARSSMKWHDLLAPFSPTGAPPSIMSATAIATLYPLTANRDQEFYNLFIQQAVDALEAPGGIDPAALPEFDRKAGALFRATHPLSTLTTPNLSHAVLRAFFQQDAVRQLQIACALEKYRLRHGAYPATLAALAPDFRPPPSVISHLPMHYRLAPDGSYTLWSAGWDGIDDAGRVAPQRSDYKTADWVWGQQPGATPTPH